MGMVVHMGQENICGLTFGEDTAQLLTTAVDTLKMDTFCGALVVPWKKTFFYRN